MTLAVHFAAADAPVFCNEMMEGASLAGSVKRALESYWAKALVYSIGRMRLVGR